MKSCHGNRRGSFFCACHGTGHGFPGSAFRKRFAEDSCILAGSCFDAVYQVYQPNRKKGWGVIAKELGIKPGSPEFHALKRGDLHFTEQPAGHGGQGNSDSGRGKGKGHGKGHKK